MRTQRRTKAVGSVLSEEGYFRFLAHWNELGAMLPRSDIARGRRSLDVDPKASARVITFLRHGAQLRLRPMVQA